MDREDSSEDNVTTRRKLSVETGWLSYALLSPVEVFHQLHYTTTTNFNLGVVNVGSDITDW